MEDEPPPPKRPKKSARPVAIVLLPYQRAHGPQRTARAATRRRRGLGLRRVVRSGQSVHHRIDPGVRPPEEAAELPLDRVDQLLLLVLHLAADAHQVLIDAPLHVIALLRTLLEPAQARLLIGEALLPQILLLLLPTVQGPRLLLTAKIADELALA